MKAARTSATRSQGANDAAIRRALMRWYRANGRHALPWRLTRDPYAVLVSEVMLQQTQVSRVQPYFEAWLQRWPTLDSLAAASPADVIRAWSGLGYNRRGLALHRLAVESIRVGGLPAESSALRALPGVGPYTAAAIQCFARDRRTAVVETNIARVLARLTLGVAGARDTTPSTIECQAAALLPLRRPRDHNLALMDLGAMVCTARAPRCDDCPVARWCSWRLNGAPAGATPSARAPRFESTARFARGRLIDALRSGPHEYAALEAQLPDSHRPLCRQYLSALEREGLVVATGATAWSLPAAATAE